jgi:DNA-binding IclR family transcriptional regulator
MNPEGRDIEKKSKNVEVVSEKVLELLRQVYPLDLSIKEIARRLGVSRVTVSKYVAVLEAEGRVECRVVGRAKLYRLKLG